MLQGNKVMTSFSITLANYLIKRYDINISDATMIIEDEWDYIEREHANENSNLQDIAENLISIYMVA